MVAERERVRRLVFTHTSTPEGVPLPSYRYGRERVFTTQNYSSEGTSSDAGVNKRSATTD